MDKVIIFLFSFIVGIIGSIITGWLGWLMLDSTFHLGFWVWVGLGIFIASAARSGSTSSK